MHFAHPCSHPGEFFRESEEIVYCKFSLQQMLVVPFKVRDCLESRYGQDAADVGADGVTWLSRFYRFPPPSPPALPSGRESSDEDVRRAKIGVAVETMNR